MSCHVIKICWSSKVTHFHHNFCIMYQKKNFNAKGPKSWGSKKIKQRFMEKRGAIQFKNLSRWVHWPNILFTHKSINEKTTGQRVLFLESNWTNKQHFYVCRNRQLILKKSGIGGVWGVGKWKRKWKKK